MCGKAVKVSIHSCVNFRPTGCRGFCMGPLTRPLLCSCRDRQVEHSCPSLSWQACSLLRPSLEIARAKGCFSERWACVSGRECIK